MVKVSDWLERLNDGFSSSIFLFQDAAPLKSAPFLDLAGYLKSPDTYKTAAERLSYGGTLEKPDEDKRIFDALFLTAEKLISAEIVIHRMLKQQPRKL